MQLPLQILPIAIFLLFLACFEAGYWMGIWKNRIGGVKKEAGVGTSIGALLGLLAFMLAFTFGMVGNRFEMRRNAVIEEANAVGTTYLRASYLPTPARTEIQQLLRSYVNTRLEATSGALHLDDAIAKSDELLDELWGHAAILAEKNPTSVMDSLFVQSLNNVIDMNTKRLMAALQSRIPSAVWVVLYFLAAISMGALGFLAGLANERSLIINLALIAAFTLVIFLIAQIDHPEESEIKVSEQSLLDLQRKINH